MAQLLGADGDYILYNALEDAGGGQFRPFERVRNVSTGADARLSNAGFDGSPEFRNYKITSFGVFGRFETPPTDCMGSCIGRWSLATGAPITLSNPAAVAGSLRVWAKDRFVAWLGSSGTRDVLSFYDAQSGNIQTITPPVDSTQIRSADITIVGGLPVVYYWLMLPGLAHDWTLYRWTAANGSEVVDTTTGIFEPQVDADADWVAYTKFTTIPGPPLVTTYGLVRRPVAGGATVTMANNASVFVMSDGVLVWQDAVGTSTARTVQAWSQARGTETLGQFNASPGSPFLLATNGFAVYRLGDGNTASMTTWNGTTGVILPRSSLNNVYGSFTTGNWFYFQTTTTVHRVAMN
jgi:hypothetical protein